MMNIVTCVIWIGFNRNTSDIKQDIVVTLIELLTLSIS